MFFEAEKIKSKGYSSFEHLGRSICGSRYSGEILFSMLTSYFDEAGGMDHGFLVICGWAAFARDWEQFEVDWRLFLAKYDIPYLHMADFAQSRPPYEKLKGKEGTRRNFLKDASTIINATVRHGFISYVGYFDFEIANRQYKLKEKFNSPYALLGRLCMDMANRWRRLNWPELEMEYVFEDGGPDKGGLIEAMRAILPYLPAPTFKPGRDFERSRDWPDGRKGMVQLQAADYLAYEARKFTSDHAKIRTGQRKFRASFGELSANKVDRFFVDHTHLSAMCRNGKFGSRESGESV